MGRRWSAQQRVVSPGARSPREERSQPWDGCSSSSGSSGRSTVRTIPIVAGGVAFFALLSGTPLLLAVVRSRPRRRSGDGRGAGELRGEAPAPRRPRACRRAARRDRGGLVESARARRRRQHRRCVVGGLEGDVLPVPLAQPGVRRARDTWPREGQGDGDRLHGALHFAAVVAIGAVAVLPARAGPLRGRSACGEADRARTLAGARRRRDARPGAPLSLRPGPQGGALALGDGRLRHGHGGLARELLPVRALRRALRHASTRPTGASVPSWCSWCGSI